VVNLIYTNKIIISMDKLTEQHLKEWKLYKTQLLKEIPKTKGLWTGFLEYRVKSLESLIRDNEE
jgi:protein tyrosine phosphatase